MSIERKPTKPFLSIGGIEVSDALLNFKYEVRDTYWYPEVFSDESILQTPASDEYRLSQTWTTSYVELDGKDVSAYFGSIHLKEYDDPRRAWEGYQLIMTTPEPFPDDWRNYVSSFPDDTPIRVLICPERDQRCKRSFECDMYVHYRAYWWSIDRPYNHGRMIMRSLAVPRSLPLVG